MERKNPAILMILTSVALGILGYFFFYKRDLGLSVPIFTVLALTAMLFFAWRGGKEMTLRRLWLILPILFFASCFFIRANETILFADALAILVLTALMLNQLNGKYLDERGWLDYLGALFLAGFTAALGGFTQIGEATKSLQSRPKVDKPNNFASIFRGLLIALPILLIFTVLLSSADPIFQDRLLSFTSWLRLDWNLNETIVFFFISGLIAWLILGGIVFATTTSPIRQDTPEEEDIDKKTPRFISLNMTETGIVLGGVVLLFAFFVFIQFTYLFGQQEFFLENMTFADYARRGFFELVAVSVMTLGLMLSLDRVTLRRAQSQQVIFRLASVLLVSLTLVMLASAWRRMSLYEEAYGFSHLRLYTHVFMFWLGALLLVGLLDIFRVRAHIFTLGALLVAIGYLGTLNVINVDAYIAEHNLERYLAGEELDICYFSEISTDAIPVIMAHYQELPEGEAHDMLTRWLRRYQSAFYQYQIENWAFYENNLSVLGAANLLLAIEFREIEGYGCYVSSEN